MTEIEQLREDNMQLRGFFFVNHGCTYSALYFDDGEMQCGICRLDFRRDDLEHLFNRVRESKTGNL